MSISFFIKNFTYNFKNCFPLYLLLLLLLQFDSVPQTSRWKLNPQAQRGRTLSPGLCPPERISVLEKWVQFCPACYFSLCLSWTCIYVFSWALLLFYLLPRDIAKRRCSPAVNPLTLNFSASINLRNNCLFFINYLLSGIVNTSTKWSKTVVCNIQHVVCCFSLNILLSWCFWDKM